MNDEMCAIQSSVSFGQKLMQCVAHNPSVGLVTLRGNVTRLTIYECISNTMHEPLINMEQTMPCTCLVIHVLSWSGSQFFCTSE